MNVRETIGDESYERVRTIIQKSFPDAPSVPDEMVDEFVKSMWRDYSPEHAALGIPPPSGPFSFDEEPPSGPAGANFPLYIGHAKHTRWLKMGTDTPMRSEFIGHLPMVRVSLPPSIPNGREEVIRTQIGEVLLSADHLVGSLEMVADKFSDKAHLGYVPERVDLITPARLKGSRFGAIALYLGYRGLRDKAPSFYLFEAGTATGAAKVLFFGKTIDSVIQQLSWYQPTPFASPKNTYRGWIAVDGVDPVTSVVEDTEPGHSKPYVNVTVQYEKVATVTPRWPVDMTLEAAQRVAAIAEAMGVPSGVPFQAIMASLGRSRKWVHLPTVETPARKSHT
jgi:hypothetical protein